MSATPLLKHQKEAVVKILECLSLNKVCILEGETRSGKSLTALTVAKAIEGPILFLTTKKALSGIRNDLKAVPGLDMDLINYHSAHKLEFRPWRLIILDECHSSGLSSFPKNGKNWKVVRSLFERSGAMALLMSGTVAIESKAQLFGELAVTGLGPWTDCRDFYAWWRAPGHYKDGRKCGGYGIQDAVKSVGSNSPKWGDVVDYAAVDEPRVVADISPYVVRMVREGFSVQEATLVPVELENEALAKLIRKIKRDKVVEVEDENGVKRTCLYDSGPAGVLTAMHMAGGGCLKDEAGEEFVLNDIYDPSYKIKWIVRGIKGNGKKYAVHTSYIFERTFIKRELKKYGIVVYETHEEMKYGKDGGAWVDSLISFAEGFDLSWLDGSQIIYSLTFKGSKFSQICDRQLKYNRVEKAKVAIPLLVGGVDGYVYEAVSNKRNFNGTIY